MLPHHTFPRQTLLAAAAALALNSVLLGQAQPTATGAARTKQDALQWLDSFARYQVLFHADDVKKLRARVEAMTPEEAAKWWEQSEPKRKVLSSPEWNETEKWLRQFLDVQAKYSDEEIKQMQSSAADKAKESTESLQEVLSRVTKVRQQLAAGSQMAEETRQLQLAANRAYRQEEVRQREAARQRAQAPAPAPAAPPPPARTGPTRYNEPLINSVDTARWMILRELFPRW